MVANGVRTPGTSRKRVEFDSSALLFGAFDFRRGRQPFKLLRRDRHPHALPTSHSSSQAQDTALSRRRQRFESGMRHQAHAGGSGADATNVGRGGSTPSVGAVTGGASARPRLISAGRWGQHPPPVPTDNK